MLQLCGFMSKGLCQTVLLVSNFTTGIADIELLTTIRQDGCEGLDCVCPTGVIHSRNKQENIWRVN